VTATVNAEDYPNRTAVNWLTYNGDHRHLVSHDGESVALGPNTYGELMYPVTATYDDVADKTRVGLSPIAPPS
jgi:hypothetical protein